MSISAVGYAPFICFSTSSAISFGTTTKKLIPSILEIISNDILY